jgi:hypothetical protein
MNKCRNCGILVPIEKAFCPNCSEPIEPEEAANRADTYSSDMIATLRDDPENYQELLAPEKPTVGAQANSPESSPLRSAPSVDGYSMPEITPDAIPPAKSKKSNLVLIIGAVSSLVLLFVILMVLKVI